MGGWKHGSVEGWRRMEKDRRKDGRMEGWKDGTKMRGSEERRMGGRVEGWKER